VSFETRMEVLGEMWTTAAISLSLYACIHQQAVVGRIGRRPHLGHIYVYIYCFRRIFCGFYRENVKPLQFLRCSTSFLFCSTAQAFV